MESTRRSRWLPVALTAFAAVVATSRSSHAAWDGVQHIVVGDHVSALFSANPGTEIHDFPFYAPDGTRLTVSWKVPKGLDLDVSLLDPKMQMIDTGSFRK